MTLVSTQNGASVPRHRPLHSVERAAATPCAAKSSARSSTARPRRPAALARRDPALVDGAGDHLDEALENSGGSGGSAGRPGRCGAATSSGMARATPPVEPAERHQPPAQGRGGDLELVRHRVQRARSALRPSGPTSRRRRSSTAARHQHRRGEVVGQLLDAVCAGFGWASSTCSGGIASQVRMWKSSCARSKWRRPGTSWRLISTRRAPAAGRRHRRCRRSASTISTRMPRSRSITSASRWAGTSPSANSAAKRSPASLASSKRRLLGEAEGAAEQRRGQAHAAAPRARKAAIQPAGLALVVQELVAPRRWSGARRTGPRRRAGTGR